MATNNLKTAVTMVDLFKTLNPDGSMADPINLLVEANDHLKDGVWVKCNNGTTHQYVQVGSLPTATPKVLGEGVAPTAGSHVQKVADTMYLESWLEIEDQVLQKAAEPEKYLREQIALHMQSMYQDMAEYSIYGNRSTDYKEINGIFTTLGAAAQTDKKLGKVVSCAVGGDAGDDTTSILLVQWGSNAFHYLYPADMPNGGIDVQDYGYENKRDSAGKITRVSVQRVRCGFGWAMPDPRSVVRLSKIDTDITAANWITYVEDQLVEALNDMPNSGKGAVLYCNNWAKTKFDIRAKDKSNVWYDGMDPWGSRITRFLDVPIRKIDRILSTEAS